MRQRRAELLTPEGNIPERKTDVKRTSLNQKISLNRKDVNTMTYKNIYAAVNRVKPCRFVTRKGHVSFELIETLDDECGLVDEMVNSLTELGADFSHDKTRTYGKDYDDYNIQYRTYFKVEKA